MRLTSEEQQTLLLRLQYMDTDNIYQTIDDLRNVLMELIEKAEVVCSTND